MKSLRAPCYQAIALAILRNDHNLYALGFSERGSALVSNLVEAKRVRAINPNLDLFQP